jgi:hypothetical protein
MGAPKLDEVRGEAAWRLEHHRLVAGRAVWCAACAHPLTGTRSMLPWPRTGTTPMGRSSSKRAVWLHRPSRPRATVLAGSCQDDFTARPGCCGQFGPSVLGFILNPFSFFSDTTQICLNFQNSYQSKYSSEIHETSSVRFQNSYSIH